MSVRPYQAKKPQIGDNTYIDSAACVIGDVVLGDNCSVWPMTVIRGDVHYIRIGHKTNIQDASVLHVTHYGEYNPEGSPLNIGDEVTIGHSAVIHACTIGNRCLVGMHATLMDDVIIEDDVMIAAHSLVSPGKRLESGYLYRGSPAKAVRQLTDEELQFLRYSANHYSELKDTYIKENS